MTSVETSADGMEEKSEGGAAAGWFQGLRPKTGLILAALKTKLEHEHDWRENAWFF